MNDRDGAHGLDSAPDSDLAERVRRGDRLAFALLYQRHHSAAWGVACVATGFGPDAEIALIGGFARACAVLPVSSGDVDLRSHVLASVRNVARECLGRPEGFDGQDPAFDSPVRHALRLLPEDWRTALWLTDVEGMSPAEVSAIVGLDPARVIPLRHLTWEMVRAAWLEAQLRVEAPARCRPAIDRLGPYARGELSAREQILVKGHFSTCADCAARRRQLASPDARLADALLPVPALGPETEQCWLALTRPRPGIEAAAQPEPTGEAPAMEAGGSVRQIWLDPLASSTPAARHFAAWALANWGATEMLDVVQLLTSELVTDAVLHTRSPFQVVLDRRPDVLRVEVRLRVAPHSTLHRPDADPGHCLLLLESLADAWGVTDVTDGSAGKAVWFEIIQPDVERPASDSDVRQLVDARR